MKGRVTLCHLVKQVSVQNVHQLIWHIPDVDLPWDSCFKHRQPKNSAMKRAVFADAVIFYWSWWAVIKSPNISEHAVWCLLTCLEFELEKCEMHFLRKTFFTSSDLISCLQPDDRLSKHGAFSPCSVVCETDKSIWHWGLFGICVCTWGECSPLLWFWVVKWMLLTILGLERRIDKIS